MRIEGARCLVTGGAGGIGRALARALVARGAGAVVLSDRAGPALDAEAAAIGAEAMASDLTDPDGPADLIARAEAAMGGIDLMCSNAGVLIADPDPADAASAPDADWTLSWDLNVMAHVRLARAALPGMEHRGGGHMLLTVSAAGLLTMIGHAPYAVTKAAALAFAQNLAITHGDRGIGVSALCPQAVTTGMLRATPRPEAAMAAAALSAEDVAQAALDGVAAGRFLILPHPEVADYVRRRADDLDRWIGGMRKMRRTLG
ncbi:SDR family oxidoreductase [Marivibrio halodurans]|uniref:SDR family oxidoreductase n=1 Tax=Marivibrio halodurans TaxID=2039722 RepID=A0A8J7RYV9_9PROT|nr:SDR family oxidoreductase [Marivibrio halodurans]MBP5856870.1 SDR family oxidoreductase [Marivibrio halodurans]